MHVRACRLALAASWTEGILQRRATFHAVLLRWLDSEGKTLITSKKLNKNQLQVNHLSA